MVKYIQKISCSQAAGPPARLGTLEGVIQGPPSMGDAGKSWVILPDFSEAIFTLKECFGLNPTELNEGKGERGVAGSGDETAE